MFGDKDATVSSIVIDAVTSGLGISMAMMGAGPISQMVVGFVGDTLSGIANGEGGLESVANAAVGCAIGAVTDYAFGIDAGDFASRKEDFDVELDYIHKKYNDMG